VRAASFTVALGSVGAGFVQTYFWEKEKIFKNG
jgi:hypothetical protein